MIWQVCGGYIRNVVDFAIPLVTAMISVRPKKTVGNTGVLWNLEFCTFKISLKQNEILHNLFNIKTHEKLSHIHVT